MRRANRAIGIAVVVTVAISIGIVIGNRITVYWLEVRPRHLFREERRQIDKLLCEIKEPAPAGIDPRRWKAAWQESYSAFVNVCNSHEEVSVTEMRQLHKDIQQKLAEPASVEWLYWLWERLAETGPHGREYTGQMIYLLEGVLGNAKHGGRNEEAAKDRLPLRSRGTP